MDVRIISAHRPFFLSIIFFSVLWVPAIMVITIHSVVTALDLCDL